MRSRKSAFFRGFLLVLFVDKSLFLHDNNTAHTETHHVGCRSTNRDFGFYACTIHLCRARYLFHLVGGLCLLWRYAAKPQKRSDAKTHGFIFIDGAFCVWQNIIRLYYAVTRQNSGVQLSAARKPDECALVKREACVETWRRWIGLRHRLATTLLRNTAVSLRDLRQPSEFSRAGGDELPNITRRTPTFGAMPMPWCRRDRDATTLRRVRRRFSVSVERSRTTGWSGFAENAAQRVLRALFLRFAVISAFFPHRPRQRGAELRLPPLSLPLTQSCGEKTSPSAIAEGRDPCKRDAFFYILLLSLLIEPFLGKYPHDPRFFQRKHYIASFSLAFPFVLRFS